MGLNVTVPVAGRKGNVQMVPELHTKLIKRIHNLNFRTRVLLYVSQRESHCKTDKTRRWIIKWKIIISVFSIVILLVSMYYYHVGLIFVVL